MEAVWCVRAALVPWSISLYLIWSPVSSHPTLIFLPILAFGLLQATLNLSLLSIYPTLFPTAASRAKVPLAACPPAPRPSPRRVAAAQSSRLTLESDAKWCGV
jgi:hypothetical protein